MVKQFSIVVLAGVGMVVLYSFVTAAPPRQDIDVPMDRGVQSQNVKPLMRLKLDAAKDILEGMTLDDFELAAAAARKMRMYSLESGWNLLQTKRYQSESEEFRRNLDSIVKAAEEKDRGSLSMGYLAMTIRCIECHHYMIERSTASLDAVPASDNADH